MNATYNMDHLQAITHVTSLLNTGATLGDAAAVSKPKTASTSHYDPEGAEVAAVSNTSYEGVTFAPDGSISGGSLSHQSSSPDGVPLSTTSVGFGANGKPGSAEINVHNVSGEGDFKKVQMDMSGATWNDSFAISAGQVRMTTIDAATGKKKHDGTLQFDKEVVASGSFNHYATDGDGALTGFSQVDYSGAKFLGSTLVGGQYAIHHQAADNSTKSSSQIAVSPLGRPQSVQTTNTSASGAVTSKVAVDFSRMAFNARNEFHAGDINYTANDDKGALLSQTTATYANAVPSLTTTQVYANGQVQNKIVVDYAASQFNNDRRVVNSTKKVDIFSAADNKLLSSLLITYDALGNKIKQEDAASAAQPAPAQKAVAATSTVQAPPPFKAYAATGAETTQTDKKTRSDGTLEQTRVTTLKDGKPVAAVITLYGANGTTVIKTFEMDLTGLGYDPASKTVSGSLNMQTKLGGNVVHANSAIQY